MSTATNPAPAQRAAVLVTGGAKRIGAAISRTLHAAGADIVIHCNRSRDAADALAHALNAERPKSAAVVQGDLLAFNALKGLVHQAHSCFGRLDGLVNNASTFYATPVGTIEEDQWSELIDANLKAPLFLAQAAAPFLRQNRGAIVNLIDIHAERPLKNFAVYTSAKAGLSGLTRSLAIDLAPEVRVNGVAPGAILWPDDGQHYDQVERDRIVAQTPLQRTGSAEDIAGAVKYLLLDATYATGQILAIDGGRSIAL